MDSHHDLRHFLAWSLPALLQEITAHPLGTVGQKVHPRLSCPVADWCQPLLNTLWMQDLRHWAGWMLHLAVLAEQIVTLGKRVGFDMRNILNHCDINLPESSGLPRFLNVVELNIIWILIFLAPCSFFFMQSFNLIYSMVNNLPPTSTNVLLLTEQMKAFTWCCVLEPGLGDWLCSLLP